jgi:hypothetical protein
MKLIFVLSCCLALTAGVVTAEPQKEEKGKRARGAGGGQQAQRVHQGGQGPKRSGLNRQGGTNAAHLNATHGNRAGRRAVSTGEQGKLPAVQSGARAGARAQVKHFDFAHRTTTNIKTVTFSANRRIVGSENWRGARYVVFRNYRPLWHDRVWWVGHYPRIVLIGGGWYYWNAGFWYPAWGYDPGAQFYPYDGPIYGYNNLPPDQVVANVQEQLQAQDYYHGEVDGLLGPQTRAALADYQRDHDLYTTGAVDEATMASLGFENGSPEQTEEPG